MTSTPPRVVTDPGVLIAGSISTGGTTERLIDAVLEGRAIAVVSPRLIRELHTVLLRDKFRQYASVEDVDAFVVRLLERSDLAVAIPDVQVCSFVKDALRMRVLGAVLLTVFGCVDSS